MHSHSRPRAIRRAGATALAVFTGAVLAISLSACAPSNGTNGEVQTDDLETSMFDWRHDVDACMLKAGFDLTPTIGPDGSSAAIDTSQFDMVAFDKAYGDCIAEVGEAPVDETLPTEEEIFDAQLLFAACMREAGYDYPDPIKGAGGMSAALGPDVDADVVDACSAKAYTADVFQ